MSKVLYTTQATATGGRNGHVESADGLLKLDVRIPKEMGGAGGATNPEQLFVAGYSACFDNALIHIARTQKIPMKSSSTTAQVSIHPTDTGGFSLSVKLSVKIEGLERPAAQKLLETAHQICPYSNATRGNIPVELELL